jgi:hypothetical protein
MKQGPDLAKAIFEAVEMKLDGINYRSKASIARVFGIQPPSLYGWMSTGRVSDGNLRHLLKFFADVTTPQHWGLEKWPHDTGETSNKNIPNYYIETGWINIYPAHSVCSCGHATAKIHPTKEHADAHADEKRIACVRVEYEVKQ